MEVGLVKTWKELTIGVQQLVRLLFNNNFINPGLVLNVKDGRHIFHQNTTKKLAVIKGRESKRAASFSLSKTSKMDAQIVGSS